MSVDPNIVNQVWQSFNNLPDGAEHPVRGAIGAAATGLTIFGANLWHRHSREKQAQIFPNPAGEVAVRNIRGGNLENKSSRRRRLAPVMGIIAGLGLFVSSELAAPNYTTTSSDSTAREAVVLDVTNSMRYTNDMAGESRLKASLTAIGNVDNYSGQIAVVETGDEAKLAIPMSRDWRENIDSLKNPATNPNGGDLASAIEMAGRQLPIKTDGSGKLTRQGRVVVISDMASAGNTDAIQKEVESLQKSGVDVTAIVPGTPNATYSLNGGGSYGSDASPETYANILDPNDIMTADDPTKLAQDTQRAITEGNIIHHTDPWRVPAAVGGALFAAGLVEESRRAVTRY